MHAAAYVHGFAKIQDVELVGIWDEDSERGSRFARDYDVPEIESAEALVENVDALLICSENKRHAEHIELAVNAGLPFISEKPIATTNDEGTRIRTALAKHERTQMTAFPCRYSPAYTSLRERVQRGDIGEIRAVCATNRGTCPFGWFTQPELSGGGAMIDHVVHVTDLLRDLTGQEVSRVQAQTNNRMYGQDWEDCALLTLEFDSGIFATLDSSWSRPAAFRTWGDVTMTVVGDTSVIELDMFGQEVHRYGGGEKSHQVGFFGTNMDALLMQEFVNAIREDRQGLTTCLDGIKASEVAIAGYRSVVSGQPVSCN
jgi:predicted dehydrogenase